MDVLKYNTFAVLYITSLIRMEVCCVGTTAANMALDFGTGWRIMVVSASAYVEGNGVDTDSGR